MSFSAAFRLPVWFWTSTRSSTPESCNRLAATNGKTIAIAPEAAGACVLTIADASNPSLTATVAITVSGGPAVVTLTPTSVSFTSAGGSHAASRDPRRHGAPPADDESACDEGHLGHPA
jgi:hypothetical protein